MLDESFLKSLTRNFTFSVYIRSGVGFNGNGGPQDFDFEIPDFGLGRFRLGNENDTYMELTWKQAHLLGDSPDDHLQHDQGHIRQPVHKWSSMGDATGVSRSKELHQERA
jgi:maltoporin